MHVVVVSHGYGVDERMKLLESLADTDQVTLVAPRSVRTQVFGTMSSPVGRSVRVLAARTRALGRGGHFVFTPSWRELRRLRPSVVQVEYDPWTPEFWSIMAPMLLLHPRVPVVLYVKKNTRHIPRGPLGWLERALTWCGMRRVSTVLTSSRLAADVYRDLGYGAHVTEVQGHLPVDGERFSPGDPRPVGPPYRVGFVGSIAPHKGVATLIDAVQHVRDGGLETRLVLAGPMCDEALEESARTVPWIEHVGSVPNRDLPEVLRTLDVFVMPSLVLPDHQEHDGHALLEAMAVGLPSVGSRSGVIPELLLEDETGWTVRTGDSQALADRLAAVLVDDASRETVGRAARRSALERVGLDSLTEQRRRTYRRVTMADETDYKARTAYVDGAVVDEYETFRFASLRGRYTWRREQRAVADMLARVGRADRVLDCPSGNGRWVEAVRALRPTTVVEADISATMLAAARRRNRDLPLVQCEGERLPFEDGSFDLVFCHALMKHLPLHTQARVLAEFARVSSDAVVCAFSVDEGLPRLVRRARRAPGLSNGGSRAWLEEAARVAGLRIEADRSCTTPVGLERCVLLRKA